MQLLIALERKCRLAFVFDCETKFLLFRVRDILQPVLHIKKKGVGVP